MNYPRSELASPLFGTSSGGELTSFRNGYEKKFDSSNALFSTAITEALLGVTLLQILDSKSDVTLLIFKTAACQLDHVFYGSKLLFWITGSLEDLVPGLGEALKAKPECIRCGRTSNFCEFLLCDSTRMSVKRICLN